MYGGAVILSYLLALASGYCTTTAAAAEGAGNAPVRPGAQVRRLCSQKSWGSRKADIYIAITDKRDHLSDENTW